MTKEELPLQQHIAQYFNPRRDARQSYSIQFQTINCLHLSQFKYVGWKLAAITCLKVSVTVQDYYYYFSSTNSCREVRSIRFRHSSCYLLPLPHSLQSCYLWKVKSHLFQQYVRLRLQQPRLSFKNKAGLVRLISLCYCCYSRDLFIELDSDYLNLHRIRSTLAFGQLAKILGLKGWHHALDINVITFRKVLLKHVANYFSTNGLYCFLLMPLWGFTCCCCRHFQ